MTSRRGATPRAAGNGAGWVARLLAVVLVAGGAALSPLPAAGVDICRASGSDSDLNGDGYDDAVVGDPYASVGGRAGAGVVVVLYGDADRRIGEGRRLVLTQASVGGSNVEVGDHFGWSVSLDDLTGDGCADLLIGSPGEDWHGEADAGIAQLVSWEPDGTGGPGAVSTTVWDQDRFGADVEAGDQFGYATAMDHSGDGVAAIGAPGEDLDGVVDAGVVVALMHDDGSIGGAAVLQQGRALPGTPERGDRLGAAVLVAPLWVTNGTDVGIEPVVVAGAPGDTVQRAAQPPAAGAGSVSGWDFVVGYRQTVDQETLGVPGSAEPGDAFGSSLAYVQPSAGSDQPRGLAVGAPGEDVGSIRDAGAVTVLQDQRRTGLGGGEVLTQDSPDFGGSPETGDHFGASVGARPAVYNGVLLLIGVPDEDVGVTADAGLVQTASLDGDTLAALAQQAYTESSAGTPGTVARGNRFGLAVGGMRGIAESVALVSSPYQRSGSVFVLSTDDTTRSWAPGVGGVPALSGGRFGWSLSGRPR